MTQPIVADLIERLRQRTRLLDGEYTILPCKLSEEAAQLIESQREVIAGLVEALETSQTALNDWLHVYAGEFCDPKTVEESVNRVGKYGTIGYIADVGSVIRAALLAAKTHLGEK